jgi:xanthine dehydrogenase molybdopterin-binding subunit B
LPASLPTSPVFPIAGCPRMPPSETAIEAPLRHVHKALQHDSGAKHVQGSAEYIDDMLEPVGTLHIALGGSPVARGAIRHVDLADVLSMPGVVTVITAAHIPGKNDISPAHADEPVFAHDRVDYHNQPVFAVVATTRDVARRAALRGKIEIAVEKRIVRRARVAGLCVCRRRCRQSRRRSAVSPERRDAHRRPGAFLSGRPDRVRDPGRGRCAPGLFLDATSE